MWEGDHLGRTLLCHETEDVCMYVYTDTCMYVCSMETAAAAASSKTVP